MGAGIRFFLLYEIYSSAQHPQGWSKCIYDDENIHYGLLQIIAANSPEFTQELLGLPSVPTRVSVFQKPPSKGANFDILIEADKEPYYFEIKIWNLLSTDQLDRQTDFLCSNNCNGRYVLFTHAAQQWDASTIASRSRGRSQLVTLADLLRSLNAVKANVPQEITEIVEAYKSIIQHLERRWP